MSMQICINMKDYDWLVADKDPEEIEAKMKIGLLLREYADGEISIGQIAEHTGRTIEEAMIWVNSQGYSSSNILSQEALDITEKNRIAKMKKLGIS